VRSPIRISRCLAKGRENALPHDELRASLLQASRFSLDPHHGGIGQAAVGNSAAAKEWAQEEAGTSRLATQALGPEFSLLIAPDCV